MRLTDPRAGQLVLPAALPRLSQTPAELRHAGPALGQDTAEVLASLLGISPERLGELIKAGVV